MGTKLVLISMARGRGPVKKGGSGSQIDHAFLDTLPS
jgi:hypothetical protein